MTKNIAIFVEGYTEQEFAVKLVEEIAGKRGVTFEIKRQHRGLLELVDLLSQDGAEFHCLIVNCCNDGQVKSQINDQYNKLKGAGYSMIVGLRDVYPLTAADIPKLTQHLHTGLTIDTLPVALHLAVLEIEAWFIEESTHFARIDAAITQQTLIAHGFQPNVTRASDLPHPAETLDNVYKTVGKRYAKKTNQIQRTVSALSYEEIYLSVRERATSLNEFISSIESALFAGDAVPA